MASQARHLSGRRIFVIDRASHRVKVHRMSGAVLQLQYRSLAQVAFRQPHLAVVNRDQVLSFELSGTILIMLIIGGTGRLYGAFLGAPLYMAAQDALAREDPGYWLFWIGLLLVAIVFFAPGGLLGLGDRIRARFA